MNLLVTSNEWGMLTDSFTESGDTLIAKGPISEVTVVAVLPQLITIAADGHKVRFQWTAVDGATRAEVTAAGLQIGPATTERSVGELTANKSGQSFDIITGNRRIRGLKLNDLKYIPGGDFEDVPLGSASDMPGNFHLVVSIQDEHGVWLPPLHAVPPADAKNMIPQTLTGANFSNGVLALPDLKAPRIRLTLAEGARPDEFEARDFSLGKVEGTEAVLPSDLKVVGPDGAVAWEFPGQMPADLPPVNADLRVALETAMTAALDAGQAPDVTFKITGSGTITLLVTAADGSLIREAPGVVRAVLKGEVVTPALGGSFALEAPATAVGDLVVRYEGLRLLETVTDAIPLAQGSLVGEIVTDTGTIREFPPQALTGRQVRRVGLIGRAPVDCELQVQLIEAASRKPIGTPGVLTLSASLSISTHWVELPEHAAITLPVNLLVRAVKGRFFWVRGAHPLARIAIFDPEYPGREVALGSIDLGLPGGALETKLPGHTFANQSFAGKTPLLESNLFLTVDVADLTLRYTR